MDIDDLLAEVTTDEATPLETRDLQLLTRAWVAERAAPELLPWPEDVMDRVLGRIARQVRCCSPTSEFGGSLGLEEFRTEDDM
jgi:GINS complex subunit 4